MKTYLKYFAIPMLIAVIASALYLVDALIGGVFISGGAFMWVGFAIWTIFYGAKMVDRIKGLIGIVVGFVAAVVMMLITGSFSANIYTISISCLIGVFVVNFAVMMLDHAGKVWLNSITGVFAGIFLTFSGFGIGLSPVTSVSNGFLMLGILVTYSILGMTCGFLSIYFSGKIKTKLKELEGKKNEVTEEIKEEDKVE